MTFLFKLVDKGTCMDRSGEQIRHDILQQLAWDSRVKEEHIRVEVDKRKVVLSGTVSSFLERQAAETDAWSIPGVMIVDNRLTITRDTTQKRPPDEEIAWSVKSVLTLNAAFDITKIEITVQEGQVQLRGAVDTYWKKRKAEELTAAVPGVIDVINMLNVVPTRAPYDETIAEDIAAALSRTGVIKLEKVDIQVEGGRVVLNGKVPDWGSYVAAFDAARYTHGVTDVRNNLVISE